MKIDENQITHVSNLARLNLKEDEKHEFSKQLSDIISYVEKISELDTSNVKPVDHIEDIKNIFREDTVSKSIDRDEINKVAPKFEDGHFIVPKVL